MNFKVTPNNLTRLEKIFSEIKYELRFEKGTFNSGYCVLEHKKVVVINKFLNLEGRINSLLDILSTMQLNDTLLTPESLKLYKQIVENRNAIQAAEAAEELAEAAKTAEAEKVAAEAANASETEQAVSEAEAEETEQQASAESEQAVSDTEEASAETEQATADAEQPVSETEHPSTEAENSPSDKSEEENPSPAQPSEN